MKGVLCLKIIMRLYRQHDLDLIYLYKLHGFSLQAAIKTAINAYVSNSNAIIDIPVYPNPPNKIHLPKQIQFHVYLSEKNDYGAIQWISRITKGYRNSVLKNLVRNYINSPVLTPFNNSTLLVFDGTDTGRGQVKTKSKKLDNFSGPRQNIADEVLRTPISVQKSNSDLTFNEANDLFSDKNTGQDDAVEDPMDMFDSMLNSFN